MDFNPLDLIGPNKKVSITVGGDAPVVEVIDYDTEPGPFFYVVADGTPLAPDMPLPYEVSELKLAEMRAENAVHGDEEHLEIVECTDEDLKWARVTPRAEGGRG
jgi:hypothetical protein